MNEQIFSLLYAHRDGFLSGQKIAGQLGLSRTAVWKGITSLKEAGAVIESQPNRGYRLADCSGLFDAAYLKELLVGTSFAVNPQVFGSLPSTNTYLRDKGYNEDVPDFTVAVAGTQTGGRGRMGRSFHSPADGLYFSVLLRPRLPLSQVQMITVAAAVALYETLREDYGLENAGVKWVNDVYAGRKKLCGILTEGSIDAETGTLHFAVMGMGVNLGSTAAFSEELRPIVTSLADEGRPEPDRLLLCSRILRRFEALYRLLLNGGQKELLLRYKQALFMLGERVRVLAPAGAYEAQAVDIDPQGGLIVVDDEGAQHVLKSGEISLKLL